jgi:DNA-binding MarR family transcriptional regulator
MDESPFHSLLASIARVLQGEQRQAATAAGLPPVQWSILSYLRDANRYSNTPLALTDYLGLTKGTVSQSLKLMEARRWIRRAADPEDRRMVRLSLTTAGRLLLEDGGVSGSQAVAAALPAAERSAAEGALLALLRGWQQTRGGRTFGVCRTCRHFEAGSPAHRCGLTGEDLSDEDCRRICREHEVP